jgi:hypothetical protein
LACFSHSCAIVDGAHEAGGSDDHGHVSEYLYRGTDIIVYDGDGEGKGIYSWCGGHSDRSEDLSSRGIAIIVGGIGRDCRWIQTVGKIVGNGGECEVRDMFEGIGVDSTSEEIRLSSNGGLKIRICKAEICCVDGAVMINI